VVFSVFDVPDSDIFENNKVQRIELDYNGTPPNLVVINVRGNWINWNYGDMTGNWLTGDEGRSKTIWNFHQAQTIDLKARRFEGIIIAPKATMKFQNPINGAVAVKNLEASSEVHFPLLAFDCPF